MDKIIKDAVKQYQCPGCVNGPFPECYKKEDEESGGNVECNNHCAGTMASFVGKFFLGMPKGFDRLGFCDETKIYIFQTLEDGWEYHQFNRPVWKYLDEHGNTLVRGLCPRTNYPWIHIFLEDCIKNIDCIEITDKDLDEMD